MVQRLELRSPELQLRMDVVPWDTAAFGLNVAQVSSLRVEDPRAAIAGYRAATAWLDEHEVRIASCRLSHESLRESMFLESVGYRFIEMVLHPRMDALQQKAFPVGDLRVEKAGAADMQELERIATHAFGAERFHVDPRLDRRAADRRYGNWVAGTLAGDRQQLLAVRAGAHIVALFIVEDLSDGGAYWHLTAVAPALQGKGYGRRAWTTMLDWHRTRGRTYVSTTISARNVRTLNLYASLQFRFMPPEMTFHWVRDHA